MKLNKDEEYFIFIKYKDDALELYKVKVLRDYEGKYGLGAGFKILWSLGIHSIPIQSGEAVSGNQFPMANTTEHGLADLLYETGDRNLIKGLLG